MKLAEILESIHRKTGQVLIQSPTTGRFVTIGAAAKHPTTGNPYNKIRNDAQKEVLKAQKKYDQILKKRLKKDYQFDDFTQWSEEVKRRYLGYVSALQDHKGNLYVVHPKDHHTMYAKWHKKDKIGLVWAKGKYNNMELTPLSK